jgi:hypothetical protein
MGILLQMWNRAEHQVTRNVEASDVGYSNTIIFEDGCLLGLLLHVVWYKFVSISVMLSTFIIRTMIMEAQKTSEASATFYQTTWCNNPEDSHLHTHHCEELKTKNYFLSL